MSNPAVFSVIAQIEQSLQVLRTLLGQRQFPQQSGQYVQPGQPPFAPQQPPQQQYLSPQEEQALAGAVDYPPQYPQPPQEFQQPPQLLRQQPAYVQPAPQYQPPAIPANQMAANRLLSQILNGGGGN